MILSSSVPTVADLITHLKSMTPEDYATLNKNFQSLANNMPATTLYLPVLKPAHGDKTAHVVKTAHVAKTAHVSVKVASRTEVATEDAMDLMSQILTHIQSKSATAKQIATAIGADKHAVNSLLYKALKPKLVTMNKPEGQNAPLWKACAKPALTEACEESDHSLEDGSDVDE